MGQFPEDGENGHHHHHHHNDKQGFVNVSFHIGFSKRSPYQKQHSISVQKQYITFTRKNSETVYNMKLFLNCLSSPAGF